MTTTRSSAAIGPEGGGCPDLSVLPGGLLWSLTFGHRGLQMAFEVFPLVVCTVASDGGLPGPRWRVWGSCHTACLSASEE